MAKDILVDNKKIYDLEYNFIHYFGYVTPIVFICFFFGILNSAPTFILKIAFFVKILIGLFLVYRFNSWRSDNIKFTDLDRKASYSAGVFIIFISFSDVILHYINEIRSFVLPYTKPIIEKIPIINEN